MSITLEQAGCAHEYDENYHCNKCGYTDLNMLHISKLNLDFGSLEFDYISDVHLDFWVKEVNPLAPDFINKIEDFIKTILKPKTKKILILAGDQGHYFSQDSQLLISLKKYYEHILIVPGNHDMYLLSNKAKKKYKLNSLNRINEMKEFCKQHEGLHYLDGDSITLYGFTFAGLGMWHDYSYGVLNYGYNFAMMHQEWQDKMNDSNYIFSNGEDNYRIPLAYSGYRKVSSFDPLLHFKSEKEKLDKIESAHVIITHYGPKVHEELPEKFKNITTSFYYFDGIQDIKRISPKYWIHGHTHGKVEEEYEATMIMCNPLGYPDENTYNEIQTLGVAHYV